MSVLLSGLTLVGLSALLVATVVTGRHYLCTVLDLPSLRSKFHPHIMSPPNDCAACRGFSLAEPDFARYQRRGGAASTRAPWLRKIHVENVCRRS